MNGFVPPDGDWIKHWESLEAELRRLQQRIRPGYVPLSEAVILRREHISPPNDDVEAALRNVDEYQYHGEPELAEELLIAAAELASISPDVWREIEQYVDCVSPDRIREIREFAKSTQAVPDRSNPTPPDLN